MLFAAFAVLWTTVGRQWWQEHKQAAVPEAPISLASIPIRLAPTSRVAVIEFADYQCPFCQAFQRDAFPELDRKYFQSGRVAFGFWQLPIEGQHPLALSASAVAECARRGGNFWPVHSRLFDILPNVHDNAALTGAALSEGMTTEALSACLGTDIKSDLRKMVADATNLGVSKTPTFFLGSVENGQTLKVHRVLVGNQTAGVFSAELEALLARY